MRKELINTLYERYPAIFAEYTQPDAEEKGYKIWCGDGWFDLINTLCEQLEYWTVLRNAPQYVVLDVKEKMGALRFWVVTKTLSKSAHSRWPTPCQRDSAKRAALQDVSLSMVARS